MTKYTLLLFWCLIPLFCLSQNDNIDSLYKQLKTCKHDTERINLLNKISRQHYLNGNIDSIIPIANNALTLSEKIKYKKGILLAYKNIGAAYKMYGENQKALNYYQKALKISEDTRDKKSEADILTYIGLVYESQDNYKEALGLLLQSLKIREAIRDTIGIANSYNAIGIIYSNQSNDLKALEYYNKSLKLRTQLSDNFGIAESYNNIGVLYLDQNKIDSAIYMHHYSIKIKKELKHKEGLALSYNNLGLCYQRINNIDSALYYHTKSLLLNEEMKNKKGIALAAYNVGFDYLKLSNIQNATFFAEKALNISREIKNLYIEQSAYSLFVKIFKKKQDYKMALYYHELASQINDSIYDLESQKNMTEMNAKYEAEKKDKALIKLEKEKQVKQLEIDNQKSQKHLLLIILLASLIIITTLILFTILVKKTSNKLEITNKILTKKNIEIEQKKEEINSQAIQIAKHQSQMNPHFIFNAINGLQGMILDGDKLKAVNQIQAFSKLLRLTLNNSENDYLTIQDEIDYLNKYVEFELHTFTNKFNFNISVDNKIAINAKIPTMLIQPMIENAIKYAELESFENGLIHVAFNLKNINEMLFLEVTISDNGKGLNNTGSERSQTKQSTHISKGINITKHRIFLELKKNNFNINNYFNIESPVNQTGLNCGTKVTMIVPYINN